MTAESRESRLHALIARVEQAEKALRSNAQCGAIITSVASLIAEADLFRDVAALLVKEGPLNEIMQTSKGDAASGAESAHKMGIVADRNLSEVREEADRRSSIRTMEETRNDREGPPESQPTTEREPEPGSGYDHWRSMAADTVHHFWFTNRESGVLLAEIDRLRGRVNELLGAASREGAAPATADPTGNWVLDVFQPLPKDEADALRSYVGSADQTGAAPATEPREPHD